MRITEAINTVRSTEHPPEKKQEAWSKIKVVAIWASVWSLLGGIAAIVVGTWGILSWLDGRFANMESFTAYKTQTSADLNTFKADTLKQLRVQDMRSERSFLQQRSSYVEDQIFNLSLKINSAARADPVDRAVMDRFTREQQVLNTKIADIDKNLRNP